ncbi:ornithine decarboxylase-like isoform X2 [Amphiura filiformis]|uniref:ornithine decarboxylase-like isoform X2 n=1 Tax=Amphiura filiformis TaxID=82378 RepID=UPI003B216261
MLNRTTVNLVSTCSTDGMGLYERGFGKRALIQRTIQEKRSREDQDDGFMLFDLGDVFNKWRKWKKAIPRVTPFYAVKCNPDVKVLRLLSALNCGFDCASKGELKLLRETIGVHPERIINANTWKQCSHLEYAREHGVKMMTFDSEKELDKVKKIHPEAELVLRLSILDPTAQFPFGIKFGCKVEDASYLLNKAKKLELNIIGVGFHIGSGSRNPPIFEKAIGDARKVFDDGAKLGFKMYLLDIGGGFPGKKNLGPTDVPFEPFAEAVNKALAKHFPDESAVHVISEPGRFFNESAGTLVVNIYGKRKKTHPARPDDETGDGKPGLAGLSQGYDYFVNNGVFSSFGRNLINYGDVPPVPLDETKLEKPKFTTTVYGDTCAEMDYCNEECELPELNIGDWLFYEDIGAYHCINEGSFNGFKPPVTFHYAAPQIDNFLAFIKQLEDAATYPEGKPWEARARPVIRERIRRGIQSRMPGAIKLRIAPDAIQEAVHPFVCRAPQDNDDFFCLNDN